MMLNFKQAIFWWALFFLAFLLVMVVAVVKICRAKRDRHHYIIFLILCYLSAIIFFVFIPGGIFQQIYIVAASLFFGAMLFYIGNFILGHSEVRKVFHHFTLFDIVILICAFFIYASLFGLYLFLTWPSWLLLIVSLVLSLILFYYYFWYHKIKYHTDLLYYFIFALCAVEITWAMTFWSTGYLARGMSLFIVFYIFSGLSKHHHQKTLTKNVVREYLVTAIIVLGLVLGSTRWTF
jgi:hypothetical protein